MSKAILIENGLELFWKSLVRYQDFIEIEPTSFNILFKNRSYETVQLHDITPLDGMNDVPGFVGSFSWSENKLIPLDGDSYYSEMLVYGYKETNGILDILVKDW